MKCCSATACFTPSCLSVTLRWGALVVALAAIAAVSTLYAYQILARNHLIILGTSSAVVALIMEIVGYTLKKDEGVEAPPPLMKQPSTRHILARAPMTHKGRGEGWQTLTPIAEEVTLGEAREQLNAKTLSLENAIKFETELSLPEGYSTLKLQFQAVQASRQTWIDIVPQNGQTRAEIDSCDFKLRRLEGEWLSLLAKSN